MKVSMISILISGLMISGFAQAEETPAEIFSITPVVFATMCPATYGSPKTCQSQHNDIASTAIPLSSCSPSKNGQVCRGVWKGGVTLDAVSYQATVNVAKTSYKDGKVSYSILGQVTNASGEVVLMTFTSLGGNTVVDTQLAFGASVTLQDSSGENSLFTPVLAIAPAEANTTHLSGALLSRLNY